MSSIQKNSDYRNGFLDEKTTDSECQFNVDAEFENNKIISATGYFKNDMIYKVYNRSSHILTDENTGIKFSIYIALDHFSFAVSLENVDKLFS